MSVTLAHQGLPPGTTRLALLRLIKDLGKRGLGISGAAVRVLVVVGIHRELMTPAARRIMASKLRSVLQARIAMRLNSLSLQKKFSIR